MTISDYTKATAEIRSAYTDYRRFMGAWLVTTSRWKADNLTGYRWEIPSGTYIIQEPLTLGFGEVCGPGARFVSDGSPFFFVSGPMPGSNTHSNGA